MHTISKFGLALIAGLMGCATAQVNTDWDANAQFTNYHTYAWMDTPHMQAMQQATLFDRRLRGTVEEQLTAKGLRKANANGEADLLLLYHTGVQDKIDVLQSGYFGRHLDVREYQQGTLVLDLVDAKSKSLVWRGTATGEVSGGADPSSDKIAKTIQKMFERYPADVNQGSRR
jgi:Domain of unknown function (DUF4136)